MKCETSLNGPTELTNESKICSNFKRCFDTVFKRKVHESRYFKQTEENTKPVSFKPISVKFENLAKNLRCKICQTKFKSVKGRKVHEAIYCGKLKDRVTGSFSSSVRDASVTEFESVHVFKYLRSYVSLQEGDAKEIVCKFAESR